ncbi:unnamed protein product [Diamesa tonsa]
MEMFKLLSTLIVILTVSHNANGEDLEDQKLQPYNNEHNQLALSRAKRMYAMCPPDFIKIGNECYYMSAKKESWLDAHFECKDRNSKLAEPLKFADKKIRKYLTNKDLNKGEKWIGGMYNWERMIWQWGYNGKAMTYQSFSNMGAKTNEDLKFHCTTLNPEFSYKWSSKMCSEKHYFICQHHLTTVSEKERVDVYNKWNETYPHQMANEFVVYLKGTSNRNRDTVMVEVSTLKNIDDSFVLDSRNTDLHPVHNSHAIAHGQNVKPKKRHSELKLTGEVNLGIDKRDRKRARKQQGGLQKGLLPDNLADVKEQTENDQIP